MWAAPAPVAVRLVAMPLAGSVGSSTTRHGLDAPYPSGCTKGAPGYDTPPATHVGHDRRHRSARLGQLLRPAVRHRNCAPDPPRPGKPPNDGWAQIKTTSDNGSITLNFEYEEHYTPPTWPSEPDHQGAMEHLDISVDDLAAATDWAVQCGATLAVFQPQNDVRVLLDPGGHPFCLFT